MKRSAKKTPVALPLSTDELVDETATQATRAAVEDLARQLAGLLGGLPLAERIEALNEARTRLHEVSPFRDEPVDLVLWLPADRVTGYDEYVNPNSVAPPELKLLEHSMQKNGVGIALVTHETDDADVVVDGMHRRRIGTTHPEIRARLHGYLPVSRIRADRADVAGRIAATVEFNRARGEHAAEAMSGLVRLLYELGWPDERIQEELGMQRDEVLRLKQITGLAVLFASRDFSKGWTPA